MDKILLLRAPTISNIVKLNFSTSTSLCKEKAYNITIRKSNRDFVDKVRILVKGGSGGMGRKSSGGLGGNGGHIIFESKAGASLGQFVIQHLKRISGACGENCRIGKGSGQNGIAKKFYIPPGTIVSCPEDGFLVDFDKPRQRSVVVKGGLGGRHYNNYDGQKGERRVLMLELKSIADIGLVGYPNAGKSTLLSNISKSKPKIGHYPFTTIRPTVGMVFYDDKRYVTVADLPGLIEDAHKNKGMGHRFLRHIERTHSLLILIDVNGFQLKEGEPLRTPFQTLCHLLRELYLYKNSLLTLPVTVALNKVDNNNCLPLFESAKSEILNSTEGTVDEILQDPRTVSQVYEKIREIRENEKESILKVSTKFGVGLDKLREAFYEHMFANDGLTDSEFDDHQDDEENAVNNVS